jgi:hypothetical protein
VDDDVVGIVLAREEPGKLLVGEHLLELVEAALDLRRFLLRGGLLGQLSEGDEVLGLRQNLLERREIAPAAGDVGLELLRRPRVLPQIGRGRPLLEFLQLRLAWGEVKDDPSIPAHD